MSDLGYGVYFKKTDYASFLRRLVATLVDATCLYVFLASLWAFMLSLDWLMPSWDENTISRVALTTFCFFLWFYMAICKPSSTRTPGYWVTGLKIVTLQGTRVPWYQMTYRLLIWICGPANFLIDAFWLFADDARQSFRDCYAGTLVVRNHAIPEGEGSMKFARYSAMGMHFFYKRAERPGNQTTHGGEAPPSA